MKMHHSTISFDLAMSTAKLYGLSQREAGQIITDVKSVVRENWERLAERYGLSRNVRQYMKPAFLECYQSLL